MGRIEFKCPRCGSNQIVETMVDMVVHSVISVIEVEGGVDHQYGEQTNEDGHVDRYQCADCGFVIVDDCSPHAEDGLDAGALAKALKELAEKPPHTGDIVSAGELIQRIANQYETLSGKELADRWNELFPEQVVYEGDSLFWVEESD